MIIFKLSWMSKGTHIYGRKFFASEAEACGEPLRTDVNNYYPVKRLTVKTSVREMVRFLNAEAV